MPEVNEASAAARTFLTLRVGERRYALCADDVAEVIRVPAMTRVPQSPPMLAGIANLRGSVLPVASARGLLGMHEEALQSTARAVVLNLGTPVAVLVDAVEDLVTIAPERIEVGQTELGAEPGERLIGSFQRAADGGAAKILDIRGLLEAAFAQRKHRERHVCRTEAKRIDSVDANVEKAEQLVTFEVAGQEFALALEAVQEVLPAPSVTAAVPRAETVVLGVTALRGTLLPLLSLRVLLGFPPASSTSTRGKVVVMNVGGTQVGLVADRARAIVSAEASLVEPIPPVLASRLGGESQIRAIYRGEQGRRLISIISPEQLFREEVMQRLKARHDERQTTASPTEQERGGELVFLVFCLGEDEFALPIDAVDEVAQVPVQITRVPKTPRFLEGVVNLRGAVLPVIDQRRRFDMPKAEHATARRLVVVRTERYRAGLIVDSVSDVLRISAGAIESAPELTDEIEKLVRGVINLEEAGRIVLLLDPLELLTRAEQRLLASFEESVQANA